MICIIIIFHNAIKTGFWITSMFLICACLNWNNVFHIRKTVFNRLIKDIGIQNYYTYQYQRQHLYFKSEINKYKDTLVYSPDEISLSALSSRKDRIPEKETSIPCKISKVQHSSIHITFIFKSPSSSTSHQKNPGY